MCGIVGLLDHRVPPERELLAAMMRSLRHRGPDGAGQHLDGRCALGARRLAVQDVRFGRQPAFSEDRSVVAVHNGEIYNFVELADELRRRGHRLASRCDTEVIPHLYEEYGDDFVDHIDGMFAIAVWDAGARRLLLVRDRIGKKPLFYTQVGGRFRFASEIKALLADPAVPREPDLASLHHFLVLQYVPGPATAFRGIASVPPGCRLVVEDGRVRTERYWSLRPRPDPSGSLDEAAERVREALRHAVARRMRSDVPVGAFLSGGVDSACVVATMAELSDRPVRTFTIGFDDPEYDERALARATAQAFDTDHSEHVVRADVAGILPTLAWHYDQPLADDAIVPYYVLARRTRAAVTVALSGEGGDEAFAGYPRMREVADGGGSGADAGAAGLGTASGNGAGLAARYAGSVLTFPEPLLRGLYTADMAAATADVSTVAMLEETFPPDGDPLQRVLRADYEGRLRDCQLAKVDVTTMAVSLEARSPMLDHRFVELAVGMPAATKVGAGGTKLALRRAFRGVVPDEVLDGRKRGFNLPLESWFRRELRPVARSLLDGSRSSLRTLLDPAKVRRLLDEHAAGVHDHGLRILNLVFLELWLRTYIDRPPSAEPPAEVTLADL